MFIRFLDSAAHIAISNKIARVEVNDISGQKQHKKLVYTSNNRQKNTLSQVQDHHFS